MGAFGLDEEWIKTQASLIGKDIKNAAMPEEQLWRLKERCDKASQKPDSLYELKKRLEQEELLKAIDKSTRTKAEILAFLESHA